MSDGAWAFGGGIAGGGMQMIGDHQQNIANARQASINMEFQDRQAQKQMDFQERMSSTSHQRETADLRAAGLNPVLSAGGGGSSTPGGAMGSGAMASMKSTTEGLASSAKQMGTILAQIKNTNAQTDATAAETSLNPNKRQLLEAQTASALATARATEKSAGLGDLIKYGTDIGKVLGQRWGFTGNPKKDSSFIHDKLLGQPKDFIIINPRDK